MIDHIQTRLKDILRSQAPALKVEVESDKNFVVSGTIPVMQGKQKVEGHYFASVTPKPKDIRLYFFPIYTHPDEFADISEEFRKCLKGKSCFHIKKWSDELDAEVQAAVKKGVELYQKDGLI